MNQSVSQAEPMGVRQVFKRWAITIPLALEEAFIAEDQYWHAWDARRSVSLTSLRLSDRKGHPVSAGRMIKRLPPQHGERVAMPPGLDGWAVVVTLQQPARASRAVAGLIAVDGNVLIATVTSDDLGWATRVWLTIRRCRTPGDA